MTSLSDFEQAVCRSQIDYVCKNVTQDNYYDIYGNLYPYVQKYANEALAARLKSHPALFTEKNISRPANISKSETIKYDNSIRIIRDFFSPKRNIFSGNIPAILLNKAVFRSANCCGYGPDRVFGPRKNCCCFRRL